MSNLKIEFYFDFLSPYSYVAWTTVREMKNDFIFLPISLPAIITHYKTLGPGQIKPKRDFLTKDLLRYTTLNNITFNFPPKLPFNSLYVLRLSLLSVSRSRQSELIDLFFRAIWEQGLDLGESENVEKILTENDFNSNELMNLISTKEVKLELRENINKAIDGGVFGVPSFIVLDENKELFWGNDSIKYLEMYLKNCDPLPRNKYTEFLNNFPM